MSERMRYTSDDAKMPGITPHFRCWGCNTQIDYTPEGYSQNVVCPNCGYGHHINHVWHSGAGFYVRQIH